MLLFNFDALFSQVHLALAGRAFTDQLVFLGFPPLASRVEPSVEFFTDVLGAEHVKTDLRAYPFSDDFSYMLEQWPGAYLFLGMDSAMCHHPTFRFDEQKAPDVVKMLQTASREISEKLGCTNYPIQTTA